MLDWNVVLRYVKNRTALPSSFIEKNDTQIIEYLTENSLTEFSNYYPDWERVAIITSDPNYKNPLREKQYLILDEEGLDIFGIRECYFPFEGQLLSGHPWMGPMSFEGMKWWSLDVFKSRFFAPFSMASYVHRFIAPNIVEVPTDFQPATFVVEYERVHPSDLRKIPMAIQQKFKDLCLADVMIWVGTIRTMYSGLQTPFGEIPLNGSELLSRGEDLRQKMIDIFSEDSKPSVTIDIF